MVEDDVVRRVGRLPDFTQDNLLLAGKLLGIESRVLQDVRQNVEREILILSQHLGVVGRRLPAGVGIKLAANGFNLLSDGLCGPPHGTLEGHMLQNVRNPVQAFGLVSGARPHPDPKGNRLDRVHPVACNRQPILQARNPNAQMAAPVTMRARSRI